MITIFQKLARLSVFFFYYSRFTRDIHKGVFQHSPFSRSSLFHFLTAITYIYSPRTILQLGVGEGVSSISMLLMGRLKHGKDVKLIGYDHFSDRSVGEPISKHRFYRNITRYKLANNLDLKIADVFEAQCMYRDIDLLNIDIDNTYEKLNKLFARGWFDCVSENGVIILEGGFSRHANRDQSRGISEFCQELHSRGFQTFTVRRYPGVVLVRKTSKDDLMY